MRIWPALAICCLPLGAVAQEDDRGYLTALLEDNLSGAGRSVVITGFAGALSSQATIERMTIADDAGIWLTLEGVRLDWSRSALLRGVVDVTELSAQEIVLERIPGTGDAAPSPEAGSFTLPDLPVSISIGRLAAERIVLGEAVLGEALEARLDASAELADGEGRTELLLERSDDGPAGRLDLSAAFTNATGQFVLDLVAEEEAGGIAVSKLGIPGAPAARLSIQGDAPITDFAASVGLVTDGQERLAGTVQLIGSEDGAQGFDVDLTGDLAPLWMPEYRDFFGDQIALQATGDRSPEGVLRLRSFAMDAQAIDLSGTATLAADGLPLAFDVSGKIGLDSGAPVLLPLSGEDQTRVQSVLLDIAYDKVAGEGWTGDVIIDGLDRAGLKAERLALDAAGRIWRREGVANVGATLEFTASGLVPDDPALAQALGANLGGQVILSWRQGGDGLRLPRIVLEGEDYGLTGRALIEGLDTALAVSGVARARAEDLARFSGLAGRNLAGAAGLEVTGRASPLTGAFDVEANLIGTDVAVAQAELDRLLKGSSRIALSAARTETGTVLRDLTVVAQSLTAQASGTVSSAQSDVAAKVDFADLSVLGGGYRGAFLGDLRFTGAAADGRVTLKGSARDLAIGQAEADRLLRGQTALSADLSVAGGRMVLNSALVENPQVRIAADGTAEGAARRINLNARLADLALLLPDFAGPLTISGTVADDGQGYDLNLRGQGPGGIDAQVAGRVRGDGTAANLTISGAAQAGLANAFLSGRLISGPVRFDLGLNGPLALSSLSGRVGLTGGRIADPGLAFALQDVALTADLSGSRTQISGGGALSSGGRVDVGGTVGLAAPFAADLRIGLRNAVLRDPQLFQTTANGEVTIRGPMTGGGAIAGQIVLSETEVQIPSTGMGGASDLVDLQHVNEPAEVRATRARAGLLGMGGSGGGGGGARPFAIDLLISAPSQIYIRGRGLDAELGGQLRLGGSTAAVVPSGSFELIRGRLNILGKRLDLGEATLTLQGNFVPVVTVSASTESDGITSFIRIDGPATEPVVSFTSTPQLPEEEVLSRLLFGRGIETLSVLQAAQLANAVATLAGRGGVGIIGRLRQGFGLDDLDVQTGADGGATVRAGKYLSENVYTEVEVDDQGQSQINLNLDVTDSVTIRGRAGSAGDTGLGIYFEKDY